MMKLPSQKELSLLLGAAGLILTLVGAIPSEVSDRFPALKFALFILGLAILALAVIIFLSQRAYNFVVEWFCGGSYNIRGCSDQEIEAVHRFAQGIFGAGVTPPETIREITKKYRDGLKIAKGQFTGGEVLVGYIFFFPINKAVVDKIHKYRFSAKDLSARDVATKAQYGHAFYVGAIAAVGFRAKAQMLGALKANEELAKMTRTKTIYAKAASEAGLRILERNDFKPVHEKAKGIECFYYKILL